MISLSNITNYSDFFNNPAGAIMSPYTTLLGNVAYMMILGFITGAVYFKTKDMSVTAMFLIVTAIIFYPLFIVVPQASWVFGTAIALGITVIIYKFVKGRGGV